MSLVHVFLLAAVSLSRKMKMKMMRRMMALMMTSPSQTESKRNYKCPFGRRSEWSWVNCPFTQETFNMYLCHLVPTIFSLSRAKTTQSAGWWVNSFHVNVLRLIWTGDKNTCYQYKYVGGLRDFISEYKLVQCTHFLQDCKLNTG